MAAVFNLRNMHKLKMMKMQTALATNIHASFVICATLHTSAGQRGHRDWL